MKSVKNRNHAVIGFLADRTAAAACGTIGVQSAITATAEPLVTDGMTFLSLKPTATSSERVTHSAITSTGCVLSVGKFADRGGTAPTRGSAPRMLTTSISVCALASGHAGMRTNADQT